MSNGSCKKIAPIIISALCLTLSSCRKEYNCSNGELCVVNKTNDIVHYSFGGSVYTDELLRGQKACTDAGKIKTRPWGGSSSTIYFNSDHGSYYYEVTKCHQEEIIE